MTVDRRHFTPQGNNPDSPVPFGENRTVPTERMATLLACLLGTSKAVLEIGTGSGYQTAILAELCEHVVSIEAHPYVGVAERLPANVILIHADGRTYITGEEFDGVLVTFAAPRIFAAWTEQVKEGGRLVVPIKAGKSCRISVYEKRNGVMILRDVPAYAPFTDAINA